MVFIAVVAYAASYFWKRRKAARSLNNGVDDDEAKLVGGDPSSFSSQDVAEDAEPMLVQKYWVK